MGVKDGQAVEIPPQYDPAKTTIMLMDEFVMSVGEIHEQAKTDHIRDHNHTVGQTELEGSALTNGRRALAHKNPLDSQAARKKREKDEDTQRRVLKQLLDRLEDLYRQIEAINERLEEIDIEINELERLQKLAEVGTLDPNNSEHAKLLKKYGITEDDIESGRLSLILAEKMGQRVDERTELQKRKESLQHEAHEAIVEAQSDGIITPAEVEQFEQRLDSLDAGVSAIVWDSKGVSVDLKSVAADDYSDAYRVAKETSGLDLSDDGIPYVSFASTLDGEGISEMAEHSQAKDSSPNSQSTPKTDQNLPTFDEISTIPKP